MSDVLTPAQRSYCMSRIRGRDTKPEIRLRKALWALGLRYRLRSKLPGKPDLVFATHRVVLFVDGCFWHGCPKHSTKPATNSLFWQTKLDRNKQRDKEVTKDLLRLGWHVIRIWEHDVRDPRPDLNDALANRIRRREIL